MITEPSREHVQALVTAASQAMEDLMQQGGGYTGNELFSACFTLAARMIQVGLETGANRDAVTSAVHQLLMMCADETKGKVQ